MSNGLVCFYLAVGEVLGNAAADLNVWAELANTHARGEHHGDADHFGGIRSQRKCTWLVHTL